MSLGEQIAKHRKNKMMSQEELAKELEVSRQAVSRWELNQSLPDIKTIKKISEFLEIPMSQLLDNKPEKTSKKKKSNHHVLLIVIIVIGSILLYQSNLISKQDKRIQDLEQYSAHPHYDLEQTLEYFPTNVLVDNKIEEKNVDYIKQEITYQITILVSSYDPKESVEMYINNVVSDEVKKENQRFSATITVPFEDTYVFGIILSNNDQIKTIPIAKETHAIKTRLYHTEIILNQLNYENDSLIIDSMITLKEPFNGKYTKSYGQPLSATLLIENKEGGILFEEALKNEPNESINVRNKIPFKPKENQGSYTIYIRFKDSFGVDYRIKNFEFEIDEKGEIISLKHYMDTLEIIRKGDENAIRG